MMGDPLIQHLVETQHEQTRILARIETKLEDLPALRSQVELLTQESREQKMAIKWLKGAGAAVIALCAWVVATFR